MRAPSLRSMCLSFANTCSIGFRSGEYLGRNNNLEGWHEHPLDISREAFAVDRAVENPWGVDAVMAQRRHKGHRLPMAVRNFGFEPLAPRRPAPERRHVGLELVEGWSRSHR